MWHVHDNNDRFPIPITVTVEEVLVQRDRDEQESFLHGRGCGEGAERMCDTDVMIARREPILWHVSDCLTNHGTALIDRRVVALCLRLPRSCTPPATHNLFTGYVARMTTRKCYRHRSILPSVGCISNINQTYEVRNSIKLLVKNVHSLFDLNA